jgi:hypothetical protein
VAQSVLQEGSVFKLKIPIEAPGARPSLGEVIVASSETKG